MWDREETFNVIFEKYVKYVTVVFNGYSDSTKYIKAAELRRLTKKRSTFFYVTYRLQEKHIKPYTWPLTFDLE